MRGTKERNEEMTAKLSWTAFLKKENSPIIHLFYGQNKITILCANSVCNYENAFFEDFSYTILDEHQNDNIITALNNYRKSNTQQWICEQCKKALPQSIQTLTTYRFPPVLAIQILKKEMPANQKMVTYPLSLDANSV